MGAFHRVKIALEWTIQYYAMLIVALAAALVFAFFLLLILDKLKLFQAIVARTRE
jgi:hypothetical protein